MFNLTTEQAIDMRLAELEAIYPNASVEKLKLMIPHFPEGSPEYAVYQARVRRAL